MYCFKYFGNSYRCGNTVFFSNVHFLVLILLCYKPENTNEWKSLNEKLTSALNSLYLDSRAEMEVCMVLIAIPSL